MVRKSTVGTLWRNRSGILLVLKYGTYVYRQYTVCETVLGH